MRIYPAIDLLGGKCVRLKQGDFAKVQAFNEDPADQARKWQSEGASFLHVVDLDGARTGNASNDSAIKAILSAIQIPIQVGGGIRTLDEIKRKLDMGVERVILGTAAIKNPELVTQALKLYGPKKIVAGVDAKSGFAATSGWLEGSQKSAQTLCQELYSLGIRLVVYTDISKDGMMEGPALQATSDLIKSTSLDVIASGGVSTMQDLKACMDIKAEGAIVGQALYIGAIRLREAIDAYEKDHPLS
ncbi:MAG: 1-(5-phosphoribosyl)-5-[(5-phosphoribosylamino)methylideneamino]imidazole-4-carboxamide isomerase [Clostridiales bacterium]|jgi:phosphoribosylformimino-5-aminoimidazole carboxamide ribotide isomerase|nr:1-(5-phosphoribosyl)-5-[(5-phosphoribosylamino)methylideneamino]imidazole-4-carboxamide isomerase [Clostridiales bacterium]